jgi:hypothetical protein
MTNNPLASLGDLTKPATVLIEKISDAVGGIFRPYQIVRVAKAEAEADRIRAESQIQVTDLHRRALHRFLEEEAKRQLNMEDITQKALPLLKDESSPQNVNDDWITNFFEKCRIVSDQDMQRLWATLLAGEANAPGTFSRRTVNLLADLDKRDAELFTRLCGFAWLVPVEIVPLVFDEEAEIYQRNGINFGTLIHLRSLGLVEFNSLSSLKRVNLPKVFNVFYCGQPLQLTLPKETDNQLSVGKVLFTQAGQELAPVCGSRPVDGFFDFVYDKWSKQSYVPKKETEKDPPGGAPHAASP